MSGYDTTNANMVGSVVSVTFADGTTASATWTTAGANVNNVFSLLETGDTYTDPFDLVNLSASAITSFSFNGVPGNTTFDIVVSPDDTPGSSSGLPFSSASTNGSPTPTVAVNYTNELIVGGTFWGDEYTEMDVTLGGSGLVSGQTLQYLTDTDNATASSPIVIAPSATPEPSSFVLLGTGVAGVAGAVRRRLRKS
jgi:hypothetical protein